jgi:hypothetical protein
VIVPVFSVTGRSATITIGLSPFETIYIRRGLSPLQRAS